MNLDHCQICQRRIGKTRSRCLVRREHIVCPGCIVAGDRERGRRIHALAAPDCPVGWHDHWDHSEQLLSGTRAGIAALTAQETP